MEEVEGGELYPLPTLQGSTLASRGPKSLSLL